MSGWECLDGSNTKDTMDTKGKPLVLTLVSFVSFVMKVAAND